MRLQFSSVTFLVLIAAGVDAFAPAGLVQHQRTSKHFMADSAENEYDDPNWDEKLKSQLSSKDDDDETREEGQGGSRFQELLKPDLDSMSVEEQAKMFRQMMAANNGGGGMSPSPRPARPSPRPVGRNRDADAIANTSDLYFAQLKRDSTVRTAARYSGDEDVANNVMGDEGIDQLEELLHSNPYLKAGRDKEQNLFDTVPEEALAPYFEDPNKDKDNNYAGVSFREKLNQRKRVNSAPIEENDPNPPPLSAPTPPVVQEEAPVVPPPPPPTPVAQSAPQPPAPTMPTAAEVASQLSPSSSPEEIRSTIRTLMGLMLKHRGGTGFGSGRLKEGEIDKFEGLFNQVTGLLRQEAMSNPRQGATTAAAAAVPTQSAPAAAPPASAVGSPGQVDGAIACIEGAVSMYKNSPPEIQSTVLISLQAALKSAITTMDMVLGDTAPASGGLGQVDSAITCIEGAVTMYKNSPPEIQGTVLISLRAALVSAVATMDAVLGQADGMAASPAPPAASTDDPAIQPLSMDEEPTVPGQYFGPDENSAMLEEIYNKLKKVSGDGQYGIRSDASPDAVAEAVDGLKDMRGILMEELDQGIPQPKPASESAEASTASRYQDMLAKARAARE